MKRETLIKELEKRYPKKSFRTTEEFSSQMKDGIWTSGEDDTLDSGLPLFDYYGEGKSYVFGVRTNFNNWLEKKGWYCEWYDCGTMMMWEE